MSNLPLMFQPLAKYVTFEGRSRRAEFWLWILFRILLNMALGVIAFSTLFGAFHDIKTEPAVFLSRYMTVAPLFSLTGLALLLPTLAVAVRRLHDTNRSGWWLILPYGAAMLGGVVFAILTATQIVALARMGDAADEVQGAAFMIFIFRNAALCFLPTFLCQIVLLVFFLLDGTPGPNRFGLDPKGRGKPMADSSVSV
jgi:uncharacterized membrane protein YhaH (DUF805 family)